MASAWVLAKRRGTPGSTSFALLAGAGSIWLFFAAAEQLSPWIAVQITFNKIQYIGIVSTGPLWLLFVLEYTHQDTWLRSRRWMLWIVPLITLILVFTNEWHHLYWTDVVMPPGYPDMPLVYHYTSWMWILTWYNYLMIIIGSLALIWAIVRYPGVYRQQAAAILFGVSLVFFGDLIQSANLIPIPLLPIALMLGAIIYFWAIFRVQLFDLRPVARDLLLEYLTDGMLVVDRDNRLIDANPMAEKILRFSRARSVGQPVETVFSEWKTLLDKQAVHQLLKVEIERVVEDKACCLEAELVQLESAKHQIQGHLVILHDITDRKHAEAERLDLTAERLRMGLLEVFIQDISHDFRTPLSTIMSSAYLLGKLAAQIGETTAAEKVAPLLVKSHEKIANIEASSRQMEKLLDDMLEATRLEKEGENQLQVTPQHINTLVELLVEFFAPAIARKSLHFTIQQGDNLPLLQIDSQRLMRALQNLVNNAITFTPSGGSIQVITRRENQSVIIEVSDNGIGIAEADLPHIFERFFRVDKARSAATGGAGLGLPITKRIVEHHGGTVSVRSVPHEGTTFTISLPIPELAPLELTP